MAMLLSFDVYVVFCPSAGAGVAVGFGASVGSGVGVASTTTWSSGSSPPNPQAVSAPERATVITSIASTFLFFMVSSFLSSHKVLWNTFYNSITDLSMKFPL